MKCSCCGEDRDPSTLASLRCHDDVKVCGSCIGWLRDQIGLIDVTPTLPVTDMDRSVAFFDAAGFDVQVYEGGGFAFVRVDGQSVFDLGLEPDMDPTVNKAGCYLIVPVPDEWHAMLTELEYPVTDIRDEEHGIREFTLTDPSGNRIRIGHAV